MTLMIDLILCNSIPITAKASTITNNHCFSVIVNHMLNLNLHGARVSSASNVVTIISI